MVRRLAARELGKRKHKQALSPLVDALQHDRDVWVREAAAQALGDLGDRAALPALHAVVSNTQESGLVREAAVRAIQTLNKRGRRGA